MDDNIEKGMIADEGVENSETQYKFYIGDGIHCGLQMDGSQFKLNNKPFRIFSGSLHYFRILPSRWEESIKKMKHCGLNTVCTYIPWNLHEDKPGVFNFGRLLDLKAFIELVQELDMFLILRLGPYICAELDFGGLPSWLLRDENMKVRSNYPPFLAAVEHYFTELITHIYDYQFSVKGGPVIAVQVENEFGSYGNTQVHRDDYLYMTYLRDLLQDLGIRELLFTCDMPSQSFSRGAIENVLMTANFQTDAETEIGILKTHQPNKPLMVAEFWSGWFDQWGKIHKEVPLGVYTESLKIILDKNASFNIYVFQGGTNFGFCNGANLGFPLPSSPYSSTVTSYDYGALLKEDGSITEKYIATRSILKSLVKGYKIPQNSFFCESAYLSKENIEVKKFLPLNKMIPLANKFESPDPVPMEMLGSSNCGQRFGFTVYQINIHESGMLKFFTTQGIRVQVLMNYNCITTLEETCGSEEVQLQDPGVLSIFVENLGRVNFTEKPEVLNNERRGLWGTVTLNGKPLKNWMIYSLDFNKKFMHEVVLLHWDDVDEWSKHQGVGMYVAFLNLDDIKDTFICSDSWTKGILFVNSFNIGRYWKIGPQQTLFLPKQLFKCFNEILVFELHSMVKNFQFKSAPILDVISKA